MTPLRVLLFSDPHLSGTGEEIVGRNTDIGLRACLTHARSHAAPFAHTVVLGDLADQAAPSGYLLLRDLLQGWPTPVTCLMGNEDRRAAFAQVFPDAATAEGGCQSVISLGDTDLFCLDSLDEHASPKHSGCLGAGRMGWLNAAVEHSTAKRKIALIHHPPAPLGLPFFDAIGLRDGPDLMALMGRSGISLCLTGHVHRALSRETSGVRIETLGSTGFGLKLGNGPEAIAPDLNHQPSYAVLHLTGDAARIEHIQVPVSSDAN